MNSGLAGIIKKALKAVAKLGGNGHYDSGGLKREKVKSGGRGTLKKDEKGLREQHPTPQ